MAQIQVGVGAGLQVHQLDDGLWVTLGCPTRDAGHGRVAIGSAAHLSREAVTVRQLESGRVEVRSAQTTGLVAVIRPDGTTVARLRIGEAMICGRGVHVVQVLNPGPCGSFVVLDNQGPVNADHEGISPADAETVTVGLWLEVRTRS